MTEWKAIKNIEKIQPDGVEECGLHKVPYYGIHYEDGTTEEADFISEHDEQPASSLCSTSLVAQTCEEDFADESDEDFVPRTHEEVLASWDSALHDLKLSLEGKLKFRPIEELFDELARDDDDEELKAIAQ